MSDNTTTKAMAEASMQTFAHEWWQGLGLELSGVNLGDALEYSVLTVSGSLWKQWLDAQAAPVDTGAPNA